MLARLEARLKALDKQGQQAGAGIGSGIGKGARTASDSTLSLAQAQARLLSTTGQNAAAHAHLSSAIGQSTGSAIQNVRANTQLAQIQNRLSGQSQTLTSLFQRQNSVIAGLGGQLSQLGGSAGSAAGALGNLAGSMGTLGAIGAAISLAKVGLDLAIVGANADLVRQRFDGLAAAAGTTGAALLGALRQASGGEISDLNLQLAANRASLLGVAHSAEEMGVLMAIAKDRAQQLGTTATSAFNDLVVGLGRGSPLILDNLGIVVSIAEANKTYAATLGKTAAALSEVEQKQALINAVLAQGRESLAATGGAVAGNAAAFSQAAAGLENIKNALGGGMADVIAPTVESFNTFASATEGLLSNVRSVVEGVQALAPATASTAAVVKASADVMESARAREAAALNVAADSMAAYRAIELQSATATAASTTAALGYASSLELVGVQSRAAAAAAEAKSNADQLASVDAQTHGVALQTLAQQAQIAAQALLASGGSGASAAAVLAGSSSQVDILTAAFYRLAAAQAAAGVAATKAKLQQQTARQLTGADSEEADIRRARSAGIKEDRNVRVKASADAAEAERNYQQTLGNTAPALARARSELAQLTAGSAAYINKQNDIAKLQQQAESNAKKGKGGAGGGAKLSDQQKLNNQLLAGQEAFDQKSETAELAHLDRIVSINEDFAKKMKDAQESFGQSQLDGRAGFYDTLGSIEDAGLRQALAAQYEAAFAEADAIAQARGADVGEKFLAARQAAIQAQGQRASEIAEATKAGDKDKAEYLAGVDKLYRDAEARKLAAITSGDDSVTAQRDAALADEAAKYGATQDKIGTAADQAAERKILAAERAGKAIDAEALKVDGLTTKYDGLGAAGARAGITPAATAASAATGAPVAPTGTSATPAAADPIAVALDGLRAAINAVEAATKDAGRGVESAVGRLQGKFAT